MKNKDTNNNEKKSTNPFISFLLDCFALVLTPIFSILSFALMAAIFAIPIALIMGGAAIFDWIIQKTSMPFKIVAGVAAYVFICFILSCFGGSRFGNSQDTFLRRFLAMLCYPIVIIAIVLLAVLLLR